MPTGRVKFFDAHSHRMKKSPEEEERRRREPLQRQINDMINGARAKEDFERLLLYARDMQWFGANLHEAVAGTVFRMRIAALETSSSAATSERESLRCKRLQRRGS